MRYEEFLARKEPTHHDSGIEPGEIHPLLFPFQAAVTRWAVRRGRAAIFADCGLGKTFMQLEWARQINGRTLIVCPLAVAQQTIAEAARLGMVIEYVTASSDAQFQITNYQRLAAFAGEPYDALVLDESSILKSLDGKTRTMILSEFSPRIKYRLACTATPAPNDLTELGNHSDYCGVLSFREMSATFFVKDSDSTRWRLKGHAREKFFQWLATWSVFMRRPSDLGFDDDGFALPPLSIKDRVVHSDWAPPGQLFPTTASGIVGRSAARKATTADRVDATAALVREHPGQWIVWCGLNDEGRQLRTALGDDCVLVEGADSEEQKLSASARWLAGDVRIMVTKPSIYGFGMNFQHCHQVAFLGIGDSYEQYYQAIRRCWRFGQREPVRGVIVTSEAETHILANVLDKERTAEELAAGLVESMRAYERAEVLGGKRMTDETGTRTETGEAWTLHEGDCIERLAGVVTDSVGLSVFSPPFSSLYCYTATPRDLGNNRDESTFMEHFRYVIRELLRATMPGRNCCVHVAQVAAMLSRDGYIGMKDFRGEVIRAFIGEGWIYHGEVCIDKDPQAQAIRTHSKALLFVQLRKDSSWLRPAMADYILVFRKPGENPAAIKPDLTNNEWIEWARPIWYGIDETDTLNYREARSDKDERHICPLQLGTIERCVRLWSNPGDLVLSPFAGIGSEGYVAVKAGRLFVGVELKREYFDVAVKNLAAAEKQQRGLFAS